MLFKQPYIEQAARDKSRAEQEKSEYDVRTIDHYSYAISTTLTPVPTRIRTPAAVVMAMMTRIRVSVVSISQGYVYANLASLGDIVHLGSR